MLLQGASTTFKGHRCMHRVHGRPCRQINGAENSSLNAGGIVNADCIQNFAQACPDGFTVAGDSCVAPAGFSGRCSSRLASTYTAAEKSAYADACSISWCEHVGQVCTVSHSRHVCALVAGHAKQSEEQDGVWNRFAQKSPSGLVPHA